MKHITVRRVALALLTTGVLCLSLAPVASAGGGNSANAKLCQKGGWQTLFTSTGSSFTSQEQCVSYAAQGGTLSTASLTVKPNQYNCQIRGGGNCFGSVSGFGLQPGSEVDVYGTLPGGSNGLVITTGAALDGTISGNLFFLCGVGWSDVYAVGTTSGGATITSNVINSPCG
jgi:hypothetical protein